MGKGYIYFRITCAITGMYRTWFQDDNFQHLCRMDLLHLSTPDYSLRRCVEQSSCDHRLRLADIRFASLRYCSPYHALRFSHDGKKATRSRVYGCNYGIDVSDVNRATSSDEAMNLSRALPMLAQGANILELDATTNNETPQSLSKWPLLQQIPTWRNVPRA